MVYAFAVRSAKTNAAHFKLYTILPIGRGSNWKATILSQSVCDGRASQQWYLWWTIGLSAEIRANFELAIFLTWN